MSPPRCEFEQTPLQGLTVLKRLALEDARGFLCRIFCGEELHDAGFQFPIVQINHTLTRTEGALRGMHFQHPPHAELKLVSCLHGEVFDVAVDIRQGSTTFLHWHGELLSAANRRSILIPEGFAHGFQTLTADCELLYLHTAPYSQDAEGALHALDPAIDIEWPREVTEMSERDRSHPFIDERFVGVRL